MKINYSLCSKSNDLALIYDSDDCYNIDREIKHLLTTYPNNKWIFTIEAWMIKEEFKELDLSEDSNGKR